MNTIRRWRLIAILMTAGAAWAQPTVRAVLKPGAERKPAPEIGLRDSKGKAATLKQYRGKILLLDFWATWCTGCKQEIPWFVEFQQKFGAKHFAIVGVSLDEGGWDVLRPFLDKAHIPYRMVLGDDAAAKRYGIESMPDTFLIDAKGRVAAGYLAGLVDRADIENNLRTLLAER